MWGFPTPSQTWEGLNVHFANVRVRGAPPGTKIQSSQSLRGARSQETWEGAEIHGHNIPWNPKDPAVLKTDGIVNYTP